MKKFVLSLMVVAALGWGAVDAQAGYIGGIPGPTGINDVLIQSAAHPTNPFASLEGIYGANLYLIAGADTVITVEYMGYEAGYDNYFFLNGTQIIFNKTTPVGLVGNYLDVAGADDVRLPDAVRECHQRLESDSARNPELLPDAEPRQSHLGHHD